MEKYGVNQLRKMFLEFFESKGHLKMNSFSLIPHNDNSLLLINSGAGFARSRRTIKSTAAWRTERDRHCRSRMRFYQVLPGQCSCTF